MSTINERIHDEPKRLHGGQGAVMAQGTSTDSTPEEPGWTPPETDPGPDR